MEYVPAHLHELKPGAFASLSQEQVETAAMKHFADVRETIETKIRSGKEMYEPR